MTIQMMTGILLGSTLLSLLLYIALSASPLRKAFAAAKEADENGQTPAPETNAGQTPQALAFCRKLVLFFLPGSPIVFGLLETVLLHTMFSEELTKAASSVPNLLPAGLLAAAVNLLACLLMMWLARRSAQTDFSEPDKVARTYLLTVWPELFPILALIFFLLTILY